MINVEWEGMNFLELGTLLSMAEDGYEFSINDGRISSVSYLMEEAA